jgi:dTDP-4-amino-4,6-dideoxygalactose transaminase
MDSADLKRKITGKSRVLIIQHTFGKPADLGSLISIAREAGLLVVEDCCHALGARFENAPVGTWGDAAYFSFSRDKVISSVLGGVAATNDPELGERIEQSATLAALPPGTWVLQQLMHPIVTNLAKNCYDLPPLGRMIMSAARRLGITSSRPFSLDDPDAQAAFYSRKLPHALAALALHQFDKLDRFNDHRRKLAALYERELSPRDWERPARSRGNEDIYLRYTIRCDGADRIRARALASKIFLGDWYITPIAPGSMDYASLGYDPAMCPVAEREAPRSLNLPTHIGISEDDALRILEYLKSALH